MNLQTVKRCTVGMVLAIAATMPGFQQLHTSVEGLKLIADYEGCRLKPYLCDAGKWTDGIGNTVGVVPGRIITERQAAATSSPTCYALRRHWRAALRFLCRSRFYDALVSLAFNVGTGNACGSTMVTLIKKGRWRDACYQLPRWVYVKGIFNQGLDNRRQRELAGCLKGVTT